MSLDDQPHPLVSIVTPSFNQAEYLEDAIFSIKGQNYPALEYIIVDGGSTDGSVEIIRKHSPFLTWWVSEPDQGQADAINKGMSRSGGEIVAWLNSDDFYLPGAVEQAVEAFRNYPNVGMVFGNAFTVDSQGCPIKELIFPNWQLEDFISFRIICQPAVFIRRSLFEQVGGLDQKYHFMLDHHLWIRIAKLMPSLHVSALWAAARHHPQAKNVSQAAGFGRETLEILEWLVNQPDLAEILARNKNSVLAGAYRLNARYLMDGGQYGSALTSYAKSFVNQPGYAIKHWHRMLYAFFGLLGVGNLDKYYSRFQNARRPDLKGISDLEDWPGLCLDPVD